MPEQHNVLTTKDHCVHFRVSLWKDEHDIQLSLPGEWQITECQMRGDRLPPLTDDHILKILDNPLGTPRLRELAVGKQKVVILFDDLARPTPAYRIVPFLLSELKQAGVNDDQIRFVCAYGCHRPLTREETIIKLGKEVVENYLVFNHNLYENLVNVGTTSYGTPVYINREVAGCDLKIGLGCIIPHFTNGYGGGAKIMVPGAAGIKTIVHNHVRLHEQYPERVGLGRVKDNPRRLDVEEATRLAGLDIIANVVVNHKKDILGLFYGDFVQAHRSGVTFANEVYATENPGRFDLIIVNSFPIEESPEKALWPSNESLHKDGDVVLIWQNQSGLLPHYLVGTFGSDYGGRKWQKPGRLRVPNARRVLIYAQSLSKLERRWWGVSDRVLWFDDWNTLVKNLQKTYGRGSRAAVFPYATLQCPIFPDCWS